MTDLPMADRPEVVLPAAHAAFKEAMDEAMFAEDERAALAAVVASDPAHLDAWAHLAEHGRDSVERYAYARVGYHRGLDAIRRAGWGGHGFVRWEHESNRGFLRCVARLRDYADELGESEEVTRLNDFLVELDPAWSDDNVAS